MISETETLNQLVIPQLEADGYKVYTQPKKEIIPAFLGNYIPDVIAIPEDKKKKNIAVEIFRSSPIVDKKIQYIEKLFHEQKDWELRIVLTPPDKTISVQSMGEIQKRLEEVQKLAKLQYLDPALLLGWGTLEAIARTLVPEQFQKPQSPRRIIETLTNQGYLTPHEADQFTNFIEIRNNLIHGELQAKGTKADLAIFIDQLEMLYRLAQKKKSI